MRLMKLSQLEVPHTFEIQIIIDWHIKNLVKELFS